MSIQIQDPKSPYGKCNVEIILPNYPVSVFHTGTWGEKQIPRMSHEALPQISFFHNIGISCI